MCHYTDNQSTELFDVGGGRVSPARVCALKLALHRSPSPACTVCSLVRTACTAPQKREHMFPSMCKKLAVIASVFGIGECMGLGSVAMNTADSIIVCALQTPTLLLPALLLLPASA